MAPPMTMLARRRSMGSFALARDKLQTSLEARLTGIGEPAVRVAAAMFLEEAAQVTRVARADHTQEQTGTRANLRRRWAAQRRR